ncbi:unnamed protein product [Cyprideis torosa]|uniref:Glycosyl transferase family 25 domain-containing protein n=1 Tax=Cyprideis torosa TaxID=163714 RepID=A0A7R8W6F6_9CRUS|nr:unnamed protein product [Cyprideis torosa]CAG0880983.1 unnamed protein product [Cyprideis torosa]
MPWFGASLLLNALLALSCVPGTGTETFLGGDTWKTATVQITILIRHQGGILPHFLDLLRRLTFPKDQIGLWIRCDEEYGEPSCNILDTWLAEYEKQYLWVDADTASDYTDDPWEAHVVWPPERAERVSKMKAEAMKHARQAKMSHVFFIDSDVLLLDKDVLQKLLNSKKVIIAPFISSHNLESNIESKGKSHVVGSPEFQYYLKIFKGDGTDQGAQQVYRINSCFLIDLREPRTKLLKFLNEDPTPLCRSNVREHEDGLKLSAHEAGIKFYVLRNVDIHGVMPQKKSSRTSGHENENLQWARLTAARYMSPIYNLSIFENDIDFADSVPLPFVDKVFVIHLRRRKDRLLRINYCLKELGIDYELVKAVDGQTLTKNDFKKYNIKLPPNGYISVHNLEKRVKNISLGNVGLILTSMQIWKKMVEENIQTALILEDDAHLMPNFRSRLKRILRDADQRVKNWDFIYLFQWVFDFLVYHETKVLGTSEIVNAPYSHGTTGYLLKLAGAKKLLNAELLQNIVPLDEYLAVIAGNHFDESLVSSFEFNSPQLKALATTPDLVEPTLFYGHTNHYSDTEIPESDWVPANWFPPQEPAPPKTPEISKKSKDKKNSMEHRFNNPAKINRYITVTNFKEGNHTRFMLRRPSIEKQLAQGLNRKTQPNGLECGDIRAFREIRVCYKQMD